MTEHLKAEGVCPVCEKRTRFVAYGEWLRDSFVCRTCGCVPRERALMAVLTDWFPGWRKTAIHESSPSPAMQASRRLREECPGYVATQFNPAVPPGQTDPVTGWRNENLEAQTFPDSSFDLVITQDVFEHLFRPDLAIKEIARTLRPGGAHVCTVPIVGGRGPSRRRARRLPDGGVEHLHPASYHGNPIDDAGSLVTIDWGYDIADYLDAHSGLNTTIVFIDDLSRGIRAHLNEVLVSRKALARNTVDDPIPGG